METTEKEKQGQDGAGSVLPAHVSLLLCEHLGEGGSPDLFALADVRSSGEFGEAWVVLQGKRLAVVDLNDPRGPRVRVTPLARDVDLEIVAGVGGSRFRVIRAGKLAEELRSGAEFVKTVRYIDEEG